MTTPGAGAAPAGNKARREILNTGRAAAAARRRADSQRCRNRVGEVIDVMRRARTRSPTQKSPDELTSTPSTCSVTAT